MTRIMITGASGFIGSQTLIPLLEKNYEIHAIYNTKFGASISPEFIGKDINWRHCNLLEYGDTAEVLAEINPDYLLHFAWDVKPGYQNSIDNIAWLNASLNLFHQFAKCSNAKKIVAAGTCFEYDLDVHNNYDETSELLKSNTLYGASKNCLYNLTKYLSLPIEFAWGRIFYVYGPREYPTRLIPYIIKGFLNNGTIEIKNSDKQFLSFVYVEDVAKAFIFAMENPVTGVFNVSRKSIQSIDEIIRIVSALTDNSDSEVLFGSELTNTIWGSSTKLNDLGFKTKIDLERGLVRTINWWKKELQI